MKRTFFGFVAAVVVACITSGEPRASTVTLDPSDDGALYVCNGCNLVSNGGYVLVSGYIQGAIKFPRPSGSIVQAKVSVNPYGLPLFGPNVDVYAFTSESGVIDDASANAGTFLGTWNLPDLHYGEDAFFDVTAFVANATAPYIGFNLRTPSGGTDVFSSIEYNYGHPSQLHVTTFEDFCDPAAYDNVAAQSTGMFTDIRRDAEIWVDSAACALNFVGSAGAAGDLWITLVGKPNEPAPKFGCVQLAAEVNIHRFNNSKAVGFVTNYDSGNTKGLFFGLYDNGNGDSLTLSTFEAATGRLTGTVRSITLGPKIQENVWYSLELSICSVETSLGPYLEASGRVSGNKVDAQFVHYGPRPAGIAASGRIGVAGQAKSAVVDSSVRDLAWESLE